MTAKRCNNRSVALGKGSETFLSKRHTETSRIERLVTAMMASIPFRGRLSHSLSVARKHNHNKSTYTL